MMMIGSIRTLFSLVLCSAAINIVSGAFGNAGPKVCIENGCLSGKIMPGYQTESFEAFVGIPFAKPPVGSLRFKNPQPYTDKWKKTYNATIEKDMCIQKNYFLANPSVQGSEDCLYLNVYRPNLETNRTYAVMVYIHGGGFFAGTASSLIVGPEYFMDNGQVILVVIQYRLGPFGFLSTGDENSPGNYAFKDQAMAIKWVHQNIEQFGGNKKLVTIFGQSAGAASVHMHMMSPLTKGYFNRAIVMSGNANAPYNYVDENPYLLAKKQAEVAGIENASNLSPKNLINALRGLDAALILNSGDKLKFWSVDPLTLFRPVVENGKSADGFIHEDPKLIWENGEFSPVSWMTSFVPHEGAVRASAILSNKTLLADLNAKLDHLLPVLLQIATGSRKEIAQKLQEVKNKYLKGKNTIDDENKQGFIDMYTDRAFLVPLYDSVSRYNTLKGSEKHPVQIFKFSFKGPYSYSALFSGSLTNYGVVHCDDLIYLFRTPLLFPVDFKKDSVEAKMIKILVDFYVDFAYNGPQRKHRTEDKCKVLDYRSQMLPKYQYLEFSRTATNEIDVFVNNNVDYSIIPFWKRMERANNNKGD